MRKGVPVLADGERHPSTRKRFGSVSDRRYLRGYRLEAVAMFRTIEAGQEFIYLNIL